VRWKGIIFLAALVGIFLLVGWLFTDNLVEKELESLATHINGAKVEIDDLQISFSELYIRWKRLQVANPRQTMKNRLETAGCELDFEFWPLFSDKFIVESFTMTGIRTNTDRQEDGKILKDESSAQSGFLTNTSRYLEEQVSSLVTPQLTALSKNANVDSVLKILDIQSIEKITALKQQSESVYNGWEQKLNNLTIEKDAKEVESQIKSIDVNQLKTADQLVAASAKVDKIYSLIKVNANTLNQSKNALSADLSTLKSQADQVDDWIEEDYRKAMSLAKIPQLNAGNIGRLIFGRRIVDQINGYLDYIALARKYTSGSDKEKPEKKSPPRLKGQDIYFYNKNARPDFWIKKINITGLTENEISWEGRVTDIVSDQRLIGKTTSLSIGGQNAAGVRIALDGLLDYLKKEPAEEFNLTYSGFSLANLKLSEFSLLPNKIASGAGTVQTGITINGDQIDGRLSFNGKKMSFDFSGTKTSSGKLEEIIQSLLKDIHDVNFVAHIQGKAGALKFTVDSNLDDLFAQKIGAIVNQEFDKTKKEIQNKIDSEVNKYRQEFDQLRTGKEELLKGEISKYENLLKQELDRADEKKKEIDNIYNKEKKNLENKVKDLIKF
jgi:uncharacterized protein (TIGR03545 family)